MLDDSEGWLVVWHDGDGEAHCERFGPQGHARMVGEAKLRSADGRDVEVYQVTTTYTRIEVVT